MTRTLVLTRYGNKGASSRLRTLQYLEPLSREGFEFNVHALLDNAYLEALYTGSSRNAAAIVASYLRRARLAFPADAYDLVWLEKEAFPWLPTVAEWLFAGRHLVVDYDDALFHRYDQHPSVWVRALLGRKIDGVMRRATTVIAGNSYLAARAEQAGAKHVEILATAVDISRYSVRGNTAPTFTVGWIGTPQTAPFLLLVKDALKVLANDGPVRFRFIGAPPDLDLGVEYEAPAWSEATEVEELQRLDCGIMPLPDAPFERGKCGYKLIQYMACGVPVVASPVGANLDIVEHGTNGYLAGDTAAWRAAMDTLRRDPHAARVMGLAGRTRVESQYTSQANAAALARILHEAAHNGRR